MMNPKTIYFLRSWTMVFLLGFGVHPVSAAPPSAARIFSDALADTVERVMPSVDLDVSTARDVQRAVLGRDTGESATLTLARGEQDVLLTIVTEAMPTGLMSIRRPMRFP